jgi:type I restriction enzyme M protein
VRARSFNIDGLRWLRDESLDDADELAEPEELATEAIAELQAAADELNEILALLEGSGDVLARQAPVVVA